MITSFSVASSTASSAGPLALIKTRSVPGIPRAHVPEHAARESLRAHDAAGQRDFFLRSETIRDWVMQRSS